MVALSSLKDQLEMVVQAKHGLGRTKTDTIYYSCWSKIKGEVGKKATNTFWTSCKIAEECVMCYPTGTLYNQIHALCYIYQMIFPTLYAPM